MTSVDEFELAGDVAQLTRAWLARCGYDVAWLGFVSREALRALRALYPDPDAQEALWRLGGLAPVVEAACRTTRFYNNMMEPPPLDLWLNREALEAMGLPRR